MKSLLKQAAETIQRLGTQTQDCTSCARLPLCNAYKDGDSFKQRSAKGRGGIKMKTVPEILHILAEDIYFIPHYKYRFIRCQMFKIAEKILSDGDVPF